MKAGLLVALLFTTGCYSFTNLSRAHTVGKGHVVMFANRPYWRWQTQGSFFLGFNAILNWNDLDAGKAAPAAGPPR